MATCNRQGVVYKRHRFKQGKCVKCGASQLQASRYRVERRVKHRASLNHPPATGGPSGNAHDRAMAMAVARAEAE
jgi:hypothetical protein